MITGPPPPAYPNAPGPGWPNILHPGHPTAEDHARHTTRPGVHYPEDVGMTQKHGKKLLSYATKGHLKGTFKGRKLHKSHNPKRKKKHT